MRPDTACQARGQTDLAQPAEVHEVPRRIARGLQIAGEELTDRGPEGFERWATSLHVNPDVLRRAVQGAAVLRERGGEDGPAMSGNTFLMSRQVAVAAEAVLGDREATPAGARLACGCLFATAEARRDTCTLKGTCVPGRFEDACNNGHRGSVGFTCLCSKQFPTRTSRRAHWAEAADGRTHGPHPGELQRLGGAFVIFDRVLGQVVATESFRLPNRSHGDDHSTGVEAETLVNALRRAILAELERGEACPEAGGIILSTDNQSAAHSLHTHARAVGSSLGALLKLSITGAVRNFAAILGAAGTRQIDVRHDNGC